MELLMTSESYLWSWLISQVNYQKNKTLKNKKPSTDLSGPTWKPKITVIDGGQQFSLELLTSFSVKSIFICVSCIWWMSLHAQSSKFSYFDLLRSYHCFPSICSLIRKNKYHLRATFIDFICVKKFFNWMRFLVTQIQLISSYFWI